MKLVKTVTTTTAEIYYHIPVSTYTTLCAGRTAKEYDADEHPPTCPTCLEILYYCKNLDIRTTKQIQDSIDDNFFDEEYD